MHIAAGTRLGRYEIRSKLGEGGMGQVYLAEDTMLHRRVALKFLPADFAANAEARNRLLREAQAAAKLDHPNICSVHECATEDGRDFIVMPYVEGEMLDQRMKRKPLGLSESLTIAAQVADALAEAHARGIVHRDIKPSNIMITQRGEAKVMDFGLAKFAGLTVEAEAETQRVLTTPGIIIGTVPYMSPEQVKGETVDARTDIFSFGVVLYEMLSGRQPFASQSAAETISAILNLDPPPLSLYSPDVPAELQRITRKCLEKDRNLRYQNAVEVRNDLRILQRDTQNVTSDFSRPSAAGYFYYARPNEIKSLAVLPLKSLDTSDNALGLGIADAEIRKISQTGKVIVRPTSAVRKYAQEDKDALSAAKELGVDSVLEGSFQRANDQIRISVNLLRTRDGTSLWSEQFDLRETEIFTVQDKVAQQVASHLRLQLDASQQAQMAKRYTSNPIAYEFYVKGLVGFDQRVTIPLDATIDFFKQAIQADPNFALAHAQLAYTYATMSTFLDPTEPAWAERAKEEINRAQELDPQLAETHLARQMLLIGAAEGYQNEAAIREVFLAQRLNPNVGHGELGFLYLHIGLVAAGEREVQRASEIDPTSSFVKDLMFLKYQVACKYDDYAANRQKLYGDKPKALSEAWYLAGKGRLDEAARKTEAIAAGAQSEAVQLLPQRALMAALKGDFRTAEAAVPEILKLHPVKDPLYHHATYDIACVYALEGKSAEAVRWLRETADYGFPAYSLFECDAKLDHIRQAPEFIQFMSEMKALNEKYRREFD